MANPSTDAAFETIPMKPLAGQSSLTDDLQISVAPPISTSPADRDTDSPVNSLQSTASSVRKPPPSPLDVTKLNKLSSPSPSPLKLQHPKRKLSDAMLSFFTLKEPSNIAFEQYATSQRKQAQKSSSSALPAQSSFSEKKLPTHVPKVNSKWDGMPESPGQRDNSKKHGSWSWSIRSPGSRQESVSSRASSKNHQTGMSITSPSTKPTNADKQKSQKREENAIAPWDDPGNPNLDFITQVSMPSPAKVDKLKASSPPRSQSMSSLPEMTCFFPAESVETPSHPKSSTSNMMSPVSSVHASGSIRPSIEALDAGTIGLQSPGHLSYIAPWVVSTPNGPGGPRPTQPSQYGFLAGEALELQLPDDDDDEDYEYENLGIIPANPKTPERLQENQQTSGLEDLASQRATPRPKSTSPECPKAILPSSATTKMTTKQSPQSPAPASLVSKKSPGQESPSPLEPTQPFGLPLLQKTAPHSPISNNPDAFAPLSEVSVQWYHSTIEGSDLGSNGGTDGATGNGRTKKSSSRSWDTATVATAAQLKLDCNYSSSTTTSNFPVANSSNANPVYCGTEKKVKKKKTLRDLFSKSSSNTS